MTNGFVHLAPKNQAYFNIKQSIIRLDTVITQHFVKGDTRRFDEINNELIKILETYDKA